jgi:hypothetical protein
MNKLFLAGIIVIAATIFYGFSSLSYKTYTLGDPQALCCEQGFCADRPCSDPSWAALKPYCIMYAISCYECIRLIARDQVCFNPPKNICCILYDGVTRYCGGPNPLKIGQ